MKASPRINRYSEKSFTARSQWKTSLASSVVWLMTRGFRLTFLLMRMSESLVFLCPSKVHRVTCDTRLSNLHSNCPYVVARLAVGQVGLRRGLGGCLRSWITVQKANVISGWQDLHRIVRKCAGTSEGCNVSRKHVHASASRSEFCSSDDHARPARLSFTRAMVPHHERTTIPENTSFTWHKGVNGSLYLSY